MLSKGSLTEVLLQVTSGTNILILKNEICHLIIYLQGSKSVVIKILENLQY